MDPQQFVESHFVEYDIWLNKTTGPMLRLVEMDSWSKLIFHRNVSKICLELVENIKHLSRKKRKASFWPILYSGILLEIPVFIEAASLILAIDCCNLRYMFVRSMHIAGRLLQ